MNHAIEVQMLNALEFFHYSDRFQEHLFVLSLDKEIDLENIVTDLRVLNAVKIRCIVIGWNKEGLEKNIEQWNRRGYPFEFISVDTEHEFDHGEIASLNSLF